VRDGCRPDAQFTASIGKHGVPNTVTPLTATAVAVLTSAYVHRNRVPVLELTPVWAIGEHRPDGALDCIEILTAAETVMISDRYSDSPRDIEIRYI
jgi:hypothetical protein